MYVLLNAGNSPLALLLANSNVKRNVICQAVMLTLCYIAPLKTTGF